MNHADAGNYAEALRLGAADRHCPGCHRYAPEWHAEVRNFGVNLEQEITKERRACSCAWAGMTARPKASRSRPSTVLATGGVSVAGPRWKRPDDTVASELTVSGLSGVHASYLAHGGQDFLIGDGALQYAPEYVWESYYSARLFGGFFASIDLQHIANPAFNQDRGPVWIPACACTSS